MPIVESRLWVHGCSVKLLSTLCFEMFITKCWENDASETILWNGRVSFPNAVNRSASSQEVTGHIGVNIPNPDNKLYKNKAWWWILMQTLRILRRQDKCFSHFLVLYGTFGKLGSIIFFLECYQKLLKKLFVPEEKSLVVPSSWVWCPYGPLGFLIAFFFLFSFSFLFIRQDVWNQQTWVLALPLVSF